MSDKTLIAALEKEAGHDEVELGFSHPLLRQAAAALTAAAEREIACAPYLKDGETPAECIARNRKDIDATLTLLAESRADVARLTAERDAAVERYTSNGQLARIALKRAEAAESALTDERQKVQALREWLAFTDFPTGFRVMEKTQPDQHHSDCSCRQGMLCDCAAITAVIEARRDVIAKLDALGLPSPDAPTLADAQALLTKANQEVREVMRNELGLPDAPQPPQEPEIERLTEVEIDKVQGGTYHEALREKCFRIAVQFSQPQPPGTTRETP